MIRTLGIWGLLLLVLCIVIVSCADTKTSDPTITLGDVYVPSLVCPKGKLGVDIMVPVIVEGTLSMSKVCWVGIFQDLALGDEVGPYIDGDYRAFQDSYDYSFHFDLADGNYAVVVGITEYISDAYVISAASQKQGPKRMAVGGPGCGNPPKLAKIEYQCMAGNDLRGPSDTTSTGNMYRFARRRFDDGNVNLDFSEYDLNIPAEAFWRFTDLQIFIRDRWELRFEIGLTTQDFFLVGIDDCTNRLHFFGDNPEDSMSSSWRAISMSPTDLGQPGAESIVFRGNIDSVYYSTPQTATNHVAVHELGHSVIGLTDAWTSPQDHDGGSSADCVMNKLLNQGGGSVHPSRSMFCSKCDSVISVHVWTGKR
jgi:hypothetical protein